jgi:hypothetical protein
MKVGRNDPCPCGSGKKYKKCCLGKEEAAGAGSSAQAQSDADGAPDDDIDFEDRFQLYSSLRRIVLEDKPHIKAYQKIRQLHSDICNNMAGYFDDGNFKLTARPAAPSHSTRNSKEPVTLRLLECEFDMDSREGHHAFYDMLFYKHSPNQSCITEEYLRLHRFRKPEKLDMLHAMLESRLGLFEVVGTEEMEGYVDLKEVLSGWECRIIDLGLSDGINAPGYLIYTRIITYQGVSFSTGLSLLFKEDDPYIIDFIKRERKEYSPSGEYLRFVELYNRYSKDANKPKVMTNRYQARRRRR